MNSDQVEEYDYRDDQQRPSKKTSVKRSRESLLEDLVNCGGIKIEKLISTVSTPFITRALHLLEDSSWISTPTAPDRNPEVPTSPPFSHLSSTTIAALTKQKAIRSVLRGQIRGHIHCFLIDKSNGCSRFIGHPKTLNGSLLQTPFSLARTTELLRLLSQEVGPMVYILETDFRNFFPQIPLPTDTQPQFGFLNIDECGKHTSHMMNVLVQGWDKSTIIAQCVSWALISIPQKDLVISFDDDDTVPGILRIRHGDKTAFVAVVYDNILIVSSDKVLHDTIRQQLLDNARIFNTRFKYINNTVNSFNFCGLEGAFIHNTIVEDTLVFQWRILSEVFVKWHTTCSSLIITTPAEVMKVFGYITRIRHVQQRTLSDIKDFMKDLSKLSAEMHFSNHKKWDTESHQAKMLGIQILKIFSKEENTWTSFSKQDIQETVIIITDASNTKLGYYILLLHSDGTFEHISHRSIVRSDDSHIDIAEAQAVVEALKDPSLFLLRFDAMIIMVDNTAASRSLYKCRSKSPSLDLCIQDSWLLISKFVTEDKVGIVDIASSDNVADIMTRDEIENDANFTTRFALSCIRANSAVDNLKLHIRWNPR